MPGGKYLYGKHAKTAHNLYHLIKGLTTLRMFEKVGKCIFSECIWFYESSDIFFIFLDISLSASKTVGLGKFPIFLIVFFS